MFAYYVFRLAPFKTTNQRNACKKSKHFRWKYKIQGRAF